MGRLFWGELSKSASFVAVIMAGGSGTRFWPLSRSSRPKQLLPLAPGGKTLLEATISRVELIGSPGSTLIVTALNQAARVREVVPQSAVLSEPLPKNTAPCLGYAAELVLSTVGDLPLVCLSADHLVGEPERLAAIWRDAISLVEHDDVLVTIGVQPTHAETGYGYIRAGAPYTGGAHKVEAFVEKPDQSTAQGYLESKHYFWNSGMFVWRASVIKRAIREHLPRLARELSQIRFGTDEEEATARAALQNIDAISIDYGVMEKAGNVVVYPARSVHWSDVGSWSSWMESTACGNDNVTKGDAIIVNCQSTAILSSKRLIAAVGLQNVIVVETDDAILVCDKRASQDVRKIVDVLKERKRTDLL